MLRDGLESIECTQGERDFLEPNQRVCAQTTNMTQLLAKFGWCGSGSGLAPSCAADHCPSRAIGVGQHVIRPKIRSSSAVSAFATNASIALCYKKKVKKCQKGMKAYESIRVSRPLTQSTAFIEKRVRVSSLLDEKSMSIRAEALAYFSQERSARKS